MRSAILLCGLALWMVNGVLAQTAKPLKKVMELTMVGEGGANGGAVTYHTGTKRYYASIAGNAAYPLCVFDSKGELLPDGSMETLVDLRGLWYNSLKNKLQGNGYGDNGWVEYILDDKGLPEDYEILLEDTHQPGEQCVGSFNSKGNEVYFFDGIDIAIYDAVTGEVKTTMSMNDILEKNGKKEGDAAENYNQFVVIYTGIKDKEIGLVNVEDRQVELFNKAGKRTAVLTVPEDQLLYQNFNVSYANGIWWFFNKETRKWTGYK